MNGNTSIYDVIEATSAAMVSAAVGGGAGVGGVSAPRPARRSDSRFSQGNAVPPRLESLRNNVNSDPLDPEYLGTAVMCPQCCRKRTCPTCGPRLGWHVRQNALNKASMFRRPALLTLTVDRSQFKGPEEAHAKITAGRFIATLLRLLGIKVWFWVLEFQTRSGDGWPHWHILIDLADAPGGKINLKRAWSLWRDRWKLGGLDLQAKSDFHDASHAVLYVTKYITKMPEAFPIWVLLRAKATRFVGASKAIGCLVGKPSSGSKAESEDADKVQFRPERMPLLMGMARCQMTTSIFGLGCDAASGELKCSWLGRARAVPADLVSMAEQGLISARFTALQWNDREVMAMTGDVRGITDALWRLQEELADEQSGYSEAWEQQVADREWEILEQHAGFWARGSPVMN